MMHNAKSHVLAVAAAIALLVVTAFAAQDFEMRPDLDPADANRPTAQGSVAERSGSYEGTLKVYVAEYESSKNWYDAWGSRYEMPFLDFALTEVLSISQFDTVTYEANWNSAVAGFGNIQQTNIVAVAAVFNATGHTSYSYPPTEYPFTAYWVDAAAEAAPGQVARDTAFGGCNHGIFVEQATATWCGYCPYAAGRLRSIKGSGNYPMYYVALVDDKNALAAARIDEFNVAGFPTVYFDGGHGVVVGANNFDETSYRNAILAAGQRSSVHDLDMTLQTDWVGTNEIKVTVTISNQQNSPPETPGTLNLDKTTLAAGETLTFQTYAADPDGNEVHFMFDYGNGETSGWVGPFASDTVCEHTYEFPGSGSFDVMVKARDQWEEESGWTETKSVTTYLCGDVNGQNDGVTIADATYLVAYLFGGGPYPPHMDAADVNNDGSLSIADMTYLVAFLFGGGPAPVCF
jgi:hypothetical protein